jgi:UDP-2-acetamido-3-amino-2,3-dideoxy-glucuronate N-acetyltransferase
MTHDFFVHPTSTVSQKALVGSGTKIWQYCTVLDGAEIGENCVLSQNVYVESHTKIGNRVKIKNNVSIYEGIEIGDDVFIGPSAVFTNVRTPRSFISRKDEFLPTKIHRGATIGANSTIICGITLGEFSFIGAGALINCDIPPFAIFYGVPAKHKGWICACGEIVKFNDGDYTCERCHSRYRISKEKCEPLQLMVP